MERYSTLWATDKSGTYGRQGASKGLSPFLTKKIGGSNVKDVVDITEKILTGFKALPGYERETLDNKPVAVVYSTMYLDRKPGMPSTMKGFCALSVNGMENREGKRESNYSHTVFFSRQDMLTAGDYNYLDLLMGTYQLTCRDVKGHRDGTSRINFEQPPAKVSPVMRNQDMPCVIKAIETIYQNKNVVIALEEGVSFNRRAMELLTLIYSMMQPALATETGFATYQTVDRIVELSAETNIQIYVVPAGTDLSRLPGGKFEILDLGAGRIVPAQTPLAMTLLEWDKFEWSYRQSAMEHLFAKNPDYLNAEEFVRVSKQFFAQVQDLNAWLTDTGKHGTVTTLEELQAEDKTQTGWKLVPWAKKAFESKCAALLKNTGVDVFNAENVALVYEYDGADEALKQRSKSDGADLEARQKAAKQYQYGRKMAGVSEAVLCRKIWEKANARLSPAYLSEIAGLNQKITDDAAAHTAALQAKDTAHQTAMQEKDAAHAAALTAAAEAKDKAVAAEKANTAAVQAKLDDADRVWGEKVTQLNADHTAALQAKDAAHQTAMGEKDAAHSQAIGKLNEDHAAALAAEREKGAAAVAAQKTETDRVSGLLTKANADLNEAKQALIAQGEELNKVKAVATRRKQKVEERDTEIERLNKLLLEGGIDPTPPGPKEPTINLLGVELPKSAMKVIAIFAAAALIIGAIISGVIVGAIVGGKDEPVEPTPPTTTAPVETTTAPTTEPTVPETTVPPTTEAPTEPPVETALLEDGSVDWAYIQENVTWVDAVETDAEQMDALLDGQQITAEGWDLEAVITPQEWASADETEENPAFVAVLKKAETEEASAESVAPAMTDLLDAAQLVAAAGERCVVVRFGYGEEQEIARDEVISAALEIIGLISAEDAQADCFAFVLEDGRTVDVTALFENADWRDAASVAFAGQDLADLQFTLGTAREPVAAVGISFGGDIAVFDYADDPDKAETLEGMMTEKGHTAVVQEDFVLVLVNEDVLSGDDNA